MLHIITKYRPLRRHKELSLAIDGKVFVQFLGDKRHDRVEHLDECLKYGEENPLRSFLLICTLKT